MERDNLCWPILCGSVLFDSKRTIITNDERLWLGRMNDNRNENYESRSPVYLIVFFFGTRTDSIVGIANINPKNKPEPECLRFEWKKKSEH